MDVKPNNPRKNLETMLEMIESAKSQNVDLIAFPEMCISGYLVGDKFTDETYCHDLMRYNDILRDASKDIAIVYGNIYVDNNTQIQKRTGSTSNHPNKDGRSRKYNAVYAYQNQMPVQRVKNAVENPDSRIIDMIDEQNYNEYIDAILPTGVQPKTLLPNYRFFDDERYFFSTKDIATDLNVDIKRLLQPFKFTDKDGKSINIGLEVCEDLWCEDYRLDEKSLDVTKILIENGAESIINVSASPWTYGKNHARDNRIAFIKDDLKTENPGLNDKGNFKPFYYVNCVGVQNNGKNIVTFDGASTVYNSNAEPVQLVENSYEENLMIVDTDKIGSMPVKERTPKLKIAEKYDAIIKGIRGVKDSFGMAENPKYVIGLSGGIDSAVVATLLCDAVGNDKVIGINMPTEYNSEKTKIAASQTAAALSINYNIIPIKKIVDAVMDTIEGTDLDGTGRKLSELNKENIQAKIRGTDMLSNIASKYGALFTNNGNKLEVAIGYATLYGDVGGAFAPIADLLKSEVFDMARYINEVIHRREIISEKLIPDELYRFREDQIEPTAGLKPNQIDPMKFGYHDKLLEKVMDYKKISMENVMEWYLDGKLEKNLDISKELIQRWNIDDPKLFIADLEWVFPLIQKNVFKRVQMPPGIITSKTSFGYDLRESILPFNNTLAYDTLKSKVLSMKSYYDNSSIYRLNFDINKLLT